MIHELEKLKQFKNAQVVINYYEDELLTSREGFHFDTIDVEEHYIVFLKGDQTVYKLKWDEYSEFAVMNIFKHYYTLKKDLKVTEIYFP